MLSGFITKGQQDLTAAFKFFCQDIDIPRLVRHGYASVSLIDLNHYTILFSNATLGKKIKTIHARFGNRFRQWAEFTGREAYSLAFLGITIYNILETWPSK